MKRLASIVVLAAASVGLVATPAVSGATALSGAADSKLRVVVSENGRVLPDPPAGTFTLTAGSAGRDSGKTSVAPRFGRAGMRDGQSFKLVRGTNKLQGKKGNLVFRFSGVAIDVAEAVDIEYGTWRISTSLCTGMYVGWRGGGRWASRGTGQRYVVRWEGLITR